MAETNSKKTMSTPRLVHEILFSLNFGFFASSVIFLIFPNLISPFIEMEFALKNLLHIRQTDIVMGYFAMALSSLLGALLMWVLLRVFARSRVTIEVLRSAAGILALFAVPCFFFYVIKSYGWPYRAIPGELAIIFFCMLLYLRGKWRVSPSISILLVAAHFIFLWFVVGGNYQLSNYAGPAAPLVSFSSAIAWGIYLNQQRRSTQHMAT